MRDRTMLQLMVAVLFGVGLLAMVGSAAPSLAVLPFTEREAFFVGTGFLSIGLVAFADLRRRNWGEPRES
jgi:hypothetical protein